MRIDGGYLHVAMKHVKRLLLCRPFKNFEAKFGLSDYVNGVDLSRGTLSYEVFIRRDKGLKDPEFDRVHIWRFIL